MEEFGASRADQAVKNTKKSNAAFKWKELYVTKLEDVNKKEKKAAERLMSVSNGSCLETKPASCCLHGGRGSVIIKDQQKN
ncbi:hypothetical protein D8674_006855 [Pyrus ussuriensis x Pyrus communis]|uniref:Uncharacterized protein n=1 Tax=Pyrus ussuriensis x Pyrus communis TaxID=2448454 RepID=A0A5N5FVF4_9ROSA|nr:hypothetical protein D8674_006855 [Pyrus ussuriensis x Pyrus communis]